MCRDIIISNCDFLEIPVGKEVDFDIITTGAGKGQVQVIITSPSGKVMAARVEETIDGFAAKFTPTEAGPHSVQVMFAGQPVPKSPFRVTAVKDAAVVPMVSDPGKVKAFGPGLTTGKANTPASFTIDTREAGPGGLGLTIEGPCEAKIECFDKGDGTCDVMYWPTEPGEYMINILYNEKPIRARRSRLRSTRVARSMSTRSRPSDQGSSRLVNYKCMVAKLCMVCNVQ